MRQIQFFNVFFCNVYIFMSTKKKNKNEIINFKLNRSINKGYSIRAKTLYRTVYIYFAKILLFKTKYTSKLKH